MSDPGGEVDVLVEVPKGSRNKYQYQGASDHIRLDRVLYASVHYPADYGLVMGTLAPDGEPLDALVLITEPTFPGCIVPSRAIGVLDTRDEKGLDQKVLAVPLRDPQFEGVFDIGDLQPHWLLEIENFFATYKTLEGVESVVVGWSGIAAAREVIAACRERAKRKT